MFISRKGIQTAPCTNKGRNRNKYVSQEIQSPMTVLVEVVELTLRSCL